MPFVYAANWKMELPYRQAVHYAQTIKPELIDLADQTGDTIILLPSYDALTRIVELFHNTPITVGAQGCSPFNSGAYTNQVSAQSLAQIGCQWSLAGHTEQRIYSGITSQQVADQMEQLLDNGITPIVCIGENEQERSTNQTQTALTKQLEPIQKALAKRAAPATICVAYEPLWAIGTGTSATPEQLIPLFAWLANHLKNNAPRAEITLMYGGSVNAKNSNQLKSIPKLGGFLIGSASLDFQKFKNIVL